MERWWNRRAWQRSGNWLRRHSSGLLLVCEELVKCPNKNSSPHLNLIPWLLCSRSYIYRVTWHFIVHLYNLQCVDSVVGKYRASAHTFLSMVQAYIKTKVYCHCRCNLSFIVFFWREMKNASRSNPALGGRRTPSRRDSALTSKPQTGESTGRILSTGWRFGPRNARRDYKTSWLVLGKGDVNKDWQGRTTQYTADCFELLELSQ